MTGKEFANRIDFCLKQRKQTRKALTKDLGLASSTMSGWSASKQTIPRADVVELIANYFDVTTDWLISGKTENGTSEEELEFIRKMRQLTPGNRNAVKSLLESLYQQEQEAQDLSKKSG